MVEGAQRFHLSAGLCAPLGSLVRIGREAIPSTDGRAWTTAGKEKRAHAARSLSTLHTPRRDIKTSPLARQGQSQRGPGQRNPVEVSSEQRPSARFVGYIYIYIERERDRERDIIYIYIYTYREREIDR